MQSETNHRFRWRQLFGLKWNPKPLQEPTIDPEIESRNALTRSAESIRYSILSFEFWLSPDGQVREFIRNNGRLATVLAIPAFLILPVITFALWQLLTWVLLLSSIAEKLIIFPILLIAAVIGLMLAVHMLRILLGCK